MRTAIAVLALAALPLSACSSDSKSATSSSSSKATSSKTSKKTTSSSTSKKTNCTEGLDCAGDPLEGHDGDQYADAKAAAIVFAGDFASGFGTELTEKQNACVVVGMFDQFTDDQLATVNDEVPDGESIDRIGSVLDDCLPKSLISDLYAKEFEAEFDADTTTCVSDALADEFGFAALIQAGLSVDAETPSAVLTDMQTRAEEIAAACVALNEG